jgi:hypothetical protein
MNYTTGVYENQILGSIVSGDNQGIHEWIFVPEGTPVRYYVSAHDNAAYVANHPEISATTDSFDVYARTIDPQKGIFTSDVLTNQTIQPNEEKSFVVTGASESPVLAPVPTTLPLTLTATSTTMTLGGSLPTLSYILSGFASGDTQTTSTTGAAVCTTTATTASLVGLYPITCVKGTLASSAYTFDTFVQGTLAIQYAWQGFLQPINDTVYHPEMNRSVFKAGSTVPVKFTITNAQGIPQVATSAPLWITPERLNTLTEPVDESVHTDPPSSGAAYELTGGQYKYTWKTTGITPGYWYKLGAQLPDGTKRYVVVGVR